MTIFGSLRHRRDASPRVYWYWRWGAPLTAGLGVLAAGFLAATASWDIYESTRSFPPREVAVAATAFAAALLLAWATARVHALPSDGFRSRRRAELVAAAVAALTGVVVAAYYLDAPLGHDETRTLLRAAEPLSVNVSRYPSTNTHVLHTLLVLIAHRFAEWDRVAARLPAFLSFCLLLPALWWFARREYGSTAALFAALFGAVSPFFVEYATNARGYTLMMLLFASALLCGQTLIRTPGKKALWATWATAIGLGFFVLPIMIFPAATAVAWMALARWRRCGRRELGPFVAKTLAWSAAALALAGVLYAPIVATEGVRDVLDALTLTYGSEGGGLTTQSRVLLFLALPVSTWHHWHATIPAWAQGAFLALVVAGATVPARSCGRSWTLLLAVVVPTGALLLPTLFPPRPRLAICALMVLLVLAGAGAGFLLERALAWMEPRWPGVVAGPRRTVLTCGVAALLLGAFATWTVQEAAPHGRASQPSLLRMTSATAGTVRPGDYFFACYRTATRIEVYMRGFHAVQEKARSWSPTPGRGTAESIHLVSAPEARPAPGASPSRSAGAGPGRLFLFEGWTNASPRCRPGVAPASAVLEANWPRHELVVAFDQGRVYAVDDWADQPR